VIFFIHVVTREEDELREEDDEKKVRKDGEVDPVREENVEVSEAKGDLEIRDDMDEIPNEKREDGVVLGDAILVEKQERWYKTTRDITSIM
jgi:hypothetical protein